MFIFSWCIWLFASWQQSKPDNTLTIKKSVFRKTINDTNLPFTITIMHIAIAFVGIIVILCGLYVVVDILLQALHENSCCRGKKGSWKCSRWLQYSWCKKPETNRTFNPLQRFLWFYRNKQIINNAFFLYFQQKFTYSINVYIFKKYTLKKASLICFIASKKRE